MSVLGSTSVQNPGGARGIEPETFGEAASFHLVLHLVLRPLDLNLLGMMLVLLSWCWYCHTWLGCWA